MHDQVDGGEDLEEGFGLILPGDARYSDYHCTDAEGNPRPFLDWFYAGKDEPTLRKFARECAWYAIREAGIDGDPELEELGPEAAARHKAFADAAEAALKKLDYSYRDGEIGLEEFIAAYRRKEAADAVVALSDADPAESARKAAQAAKGAGVDPYVIGKVAAILHRDAGGGSR